MKTRLIVLLLLVGVVSAATTITFNINNTYGMKLLAAFDAQDDCHVTISFRGSENALDANVPDYSASIDFRTPVRAPGDTNAQYVKKRVGLIIDACRAAHAAKLKNDTLKAYNLNAPLVDVNEPNAVGE